MSPDWKKVVETVAPAIGAALGGPLVGTALAAVSQAVLGKPDAAEAELAPVVAAASPDVLLKLKQAENDFKEKMEELGLQRMMAPMQLEVDDRKDARGMMVGTIAQLKGTPQLILTIAYQVGFFVVFGLLLYWATQGALKAVPDYWQGVLTATFTLLVQAVLSQLKFWFGGTIQQQEAATALATSVPLSALPAAAAVKEATP